MGASLTDLSFHHAAAQWQIVDTLQQELLGIHELARKQRHALMWAETLQRERLLASIDKAQGLVDTYAERLEQARRQALLLTSRAASKAWGVQLGHEYSFCDHTGAVRCQFYVDLLRPVLDLRPGESAVFLCGGESEGKRALILLGRDAMVAHEQESNVIRLGGLLPRPH
ncbi:hypothetical protein [Burkholderia cenocepacia]|uniref:hypothetical protein n=1 Tax=Burkholderia cenocepacia TaxID=95486 RepID=UPI00076133F1|nr:hypothetical protein [Burkholderia cenocepacia]KWU24731.1 hypothetical protein AS149_31795 [Burkholderia cenocepacia]